jgi:selenocysteine lyase/cysteine desulfurase
MIKPFDENARPVVIVDGAQSIGNIEVSGRLFEQIEYYATGAHKWLLVPRPLGVLIRNSDLLLTKHQYATLEMPNRPDSAFPVSNRPFSVTISYDPYFGLSGALRDEFQAIRMNNIATHNRRLADAFRNEMLSFGYRSIGDDSHSSIVSISFGSVTEPLHRSLQLHGVKCKFLQLKLDEDALPIIRFCFHLYHSKEDLFRLLDRIEGELVKVKM